jgi:hypothetical protein
VVSLFAELTALGCQSGKSNWSFEFLRLVVWCLLLAWLDQSARIL